MKTKIITFSTAILLMFNFCNSNHNKIVAKKQDTIVNHLEFPATVIVEDTSFFMPVDSTFTLTGRGNGATGQIVRGTIHIGDACLLYTSDAADERSSVDLGGRRIIKKKK